MSKKHNYRQGPLTDDIGEMPDTPDYVNRSFSTRHNEGASQPKLPLMCCGIQFCVFIPAVLAQEGVHYDYGLAVLKEGALIAFSFINGILEADHTDAMGVAAFVTGEKISRAVTFNCNGSDKDGFRKYRGRMTPTMGVSKMMEKTYLKLAKTPYTVFLNYNNAVLGTMRIDVKMLARLSGFIPEFDELYENAR